MNEYYRLTAPMKVPASEQATAIVLAAAISNEIAATLDEVVHDAHNQLASEINNRGPIAQVEWLLEHGFGLDTLGESDGI